MTDATPGKFWHRAGPIAAVSALLLGGISQGCGDSATGAGGAGGVGGATSSSTGANTGGTNPGGSNPGGGGSTGTAGGGAGSLTAKAVTNDSATFTSPFDATPNPAGDTIYFTGLDTGGLSGVFKVKTTGGSVTTVSKGDPLVAPFNIATSSDGNTLYVADVGAEPKSGDTGVIWSMGTALDQTPKEVSGTDGKSARALVVVVEGTTDFIYFTGLTSSGEAGVFKVKASGGTATTVASGAPLVDPSGIAVAANGDIYVADTVGSASHDAQIVKIKGTAVTAFVTDLKVNYPAGVAITTDDATLLVSSLDPDGGTDQIVQIDTSSKAEKAFTKSGSVDLTKLIDAAGMHRSVNKDVFSWVDSSAGNSGTIYLLNFQ